MRPQKEVSYTNSESPQKMLSDDMLRFVFVYGARFADALSVNLETSILNCILTETGHMSELSV